MGAQMLAGAAAIGDWLGSLPRSPEMIQRFAALDTLARSGRLAVVRRTAGLPAEHGWRMVLDAAAGLEPVDDRRPATRGVLAAPATMRARFLVAHEAQGERPCDLARRLGLSRVETERAIMWGKRHGFLEGRAGRWSRVQEGRPW